jgi:hypothetical protein
MKKLPIYRVKVGGEFADAKLDYVSLVDQPAIQTKGLLFSNNLIFKFEKEKQIITGPAMIPNQLIYRRDKEMGEFYVVFEADAIIELATKFNREVKEFKINVDHADVVPSAFITESWIVDNPEMDKAKSLGFDVPAGTWMLSVKVEDEAFWNDEVKAKGQFGFSVEGLFGLEATNEMFKNIQPEEEMDFESYTDYPDAVVENANIALRWAEENGWGNCGTPVGKARANQLANREPISEETIARMASFARHRENSTKELGDGCGRLMWLAWGGDEGVEWASRKLEDIRNSQSEEFAHIDNNNNLELNKETMNKSKLKFEEAMLADGTSVWVSSLEVGGEVYLFDRETLEKTPAPDGNHELQDGTVVTTVDGKITEIKAKEVESETGEEVEVEVEAAVDPVLDSEAVLAIVEPVLQAKLDEVYGVIAELKAMLEGAQAPATVTDEAMSSHKFEVVNPLAGYLQFIKNK